MIASKTGHVDVVGSCSRARRRGQQATPDGFTALIVASQNGHVEVVRLP
jgi:hypothetical protein